MNDHVKTLEHFVDSIGSDYAIEAAAVRALLEENEWLRNLDELARKAIDAEFRLRREAEARIEELEREPRGAE